MPNYGWRGRHPDTKGANGEIVRGVSRGLRTLPNPGTPDKVDVATKAAPPVGRIFCTVDGCGKRFKIPATMAMHFRRDHKDLNTSKESWKEFMGKD